MDRNSRSQKIKIITLLGNSSFYSNLNFACWVMLADELPK